MARRRLHAVLRAADAQRAGLAELSRDRPRPCGRLINSGRARARARQVRIGGGDEPDGALHRRRPHHRSHQLVATPSSPTIRSAARLRLALDLTLRDTQRRPRHARRFHARDVARVRQAGRQPRGLRRPPYTIDDAEATLAEVSRRRRRSRATSSRATSDGHEVADYSRLLARAGFIVRKVNAGRAWLGDSDLRTRQRRHASRQRGGAGHRPIRRRHRSGRRMHVIDGQHDHERVRSSPRRSQAHAAWRHVSDRGRRSRRGRAFQDA